ncbi:Serine/threonine-protein kinase AFC3 like [Verticillium longisporum]|uniref:Serine/threonine-protein kinase AFC3 like n=1 Tax=Verticillium longisporum TaxID=100787 RepID=A0A8I3A0R0_VERLO|nr:Serine/threonine-protein kinase AFC3 like [Verticillium longisporum]
MASFLRKIPWPSRVWKPLTFSNSNFIRIPPGERVEEELFPDYKASRYYPVIIGQVLKDRYQIVGKLGFGVSSTVWLARDLEGRRHVALKLFIHSQSMGGQLDREVSIYKHIKADNIMLGIEDDSVFTAFEEEELSDPSPRKTVDGRSIYVSRELQLPKAWGAPVLCDFGSAVIGEIEHLEDVQPDIYRAPEVIVEAPWSYSIDIWNTGCVIWDLFEGEIIGLLGPPPQTLLQTGRSSHKFFTDTGNLRGADLGLLAGASLEERETSLKGDSQKKFLAMMRKMLQWEPSKRSSAKALAEDEWIVANIQ